MKVVSDKDLVELLDGSLEMTSVKNHVLLTHDRAIKRFHGGSRSTPRFNREVKALRRLQGLEGFPTLLEVSPADRRLQISRVDGQPMSTCEKIPDSVFVSLRQQVQTMLERGVARHSLPARDVIVRNDGSAGLVDFERSRCRRFRFGLIWLASCQVTRFQLLRLIDEQAPHLLNGRERRWLDLQRNLRTIYRRYWLDVRQRRRNRTGKR